MQLEKKLKQPLDYFLLLESIMWVCGLPAEESVYGCFFWLSSDFLEHLNEQMTCAFAWSG